MPLRTKKPNSKPKRQRPQLSGIKARVSPALLLRIMADVDKTSRRTKASKVDLVYVYDLFLCAQSKMPNDGKDYRFSEADALEWAGKVITVWERNGGNLRLTASGVLYTLAARNHITYTRPQEDTSATKQPAEPVRDDKPEQEGDTGPAGGDNDGA